MLRICIKYDITPYTFENIANRIGLLINWEDYNINESDEVLCDFFLDIFNFEPLGQEVIVITDYLIKSKAYYEIVKHKDLRYYMLDYYPEKYNMFFFQPEDVIICSVEDKRVLLLHHEGKFCVIDFGRAG